MPGAVHSLPRIEEALVAARASFFSVFTIRAQFRVVLLIAIRSPLKRSMIRFDSRPLFLRVGGHFGANRLFEYIKVGSMNYLHCRNAPEFT